MKMPLFDDVITHNTTVLTIFGRISMVCTNLALLIPIMSIKVKLGWVGLGMVLLVIHASSAGYLSNGLVNGYELASIFQILSVSRRA
jgi:hypothetical protein